MASRRVFLISVITASAVLAGCASEPEKKPKEPYKVPELTLHLEEDCTVHQPTVEKVPLEKGFAAIAEGRYIDASQDFKRYQRLESSREAQLEAEIGIAYISILSDSPFYDTTAARKSYRSLRKRLTPDMRLHEQTLMMHRSLETFLMMERQIKELKENEADLKKDLDKREEALKRLRELTLGQ